MGVSTNLGTKVNRRKRAVRLDPNVMKNVSSEWGNEGGGIVIKINNARERAEEVPFYELFLGYPKFLTAVVDDGVLMRVTVNSKGTGGGVEKIRKEVS